MGLGLGGWPKPPSGWAGRLAPTWSERSPYLQGCSRSSVQMLTQHHSQLGVELKSLREPLLHPSPAGVCTASLDPTPQLGRCRGSGGGVRGLALLPLAGVWAVAEGTEAPGLLGSSAWMAPVGSALQQLPQAQRHSTSVNVQRQCSRNPGS